MTLSSSAWVPLVDAEASAACRSAALSTQNVWAAAMRQVARTAAATTSRKHGLRNMACTPGATVSQELRKRRREPGESARVRAHFALGLPAIVLVGLFLDQRRAELFVDGALDLGALVVADVDRAREL